MMGSEAADSVAAGGQGMTVYHSTAAHIAATVKREKFGLDKYELGFGSVKGRGVYCAPTVKGAAPWFCYGITQMVTLKCRLRPGLRIAWIEKDYDKKLVAQLRSEFGKEVLDSPNTFHKALPKNKQLRKDELLALLGYFFHQRMKRNDLNRRKVWLRVQENWWRKHFAHLRKHLELHDFQAIGDRSEAAWDTEEIVVFNPADIEPISAHLLDLSRCGVLTVDEDEQFENAVLLPPLSDGELGRLSMKSKSEIRELEAE